MTQVIVPQCLDNLFLGIAKNNKDKDGNLIETLCYLVGHKDQGRTVATYVIFPKQSASASHVDDNGIFDIDTLTWLTSFSEPFKKYGDNFSVIAWVHSHVRGSPCGFSSIDVHTQYSLQRIFDNILGLVYEIKANGSYIAEWFNLTSEGEKQVRICSQTKNISSIQHSQCSDQSFFKSETEKVTTENYILETIDGREFTQTFVRDHSSTTNSEIQKFFCLICSKRWESLKSLYLHIIRSKKCKEKYDKNEFENIKITREKEKKAKLQKSDKQYIEANREHVAKKLKQYHKEHRDVRIVEMKKIYEKKKKFQNAISWGPIFPCLCCHRVFL